MDALIWSTGVDVFSPDDAFVHVPDCSDFRVQTEREGNLLHVSLTPITRAEVSAKEVRSRIRGSSLEEFNLTRCVIAALDEIDFSGGLEKMIFLRAQSICF